MVIGSEIYCVVLFNEGTEKLRSVSLQNENIITITIGRKRIMQFYRRRNPNSF